MPVTAEEEIVVLYSLYCLGGAATKADATEFILSRQLLQSLPGDDDTVATGETRIANRIAWSRENLTRKNPIQLSMPRHGTWQITAAGQERLFRTAKRSCQDDKNGVATFDDIFWDRFSAKFLRGLRSLGTARIKYDEQMAS